MNDTPVRYYPTRWTQQKAHGRQRRADMGGRGGSGGGKGGGGSGGGGGGPVAQLAGMTSRQQATEFLSAMSRTELNALGQQLGGLQQGVRNKTDLIDRIVQSTVGARLNSAVLRDRVNFQHLRA